MLSSNDSRVITETFSEFYCCRSRAACHAVVDEIVGAWGAVHHLVNCAAYFGSKDLDATEEDWDMTKR